MRKILSFFKIPAVVLLGIVSYVVLQYGFQAKVAAQTIVLVAILVGSWDLIRDTAHDLLHKQFALDYIAILAIITALVTHNYLVAAVITLMLSGGNTLEEYATMLAKKSLTTLASRIPHDVNLWDGGAIAGKQLIEKVTVGQEIAVRKGEVIPLDGVLLSEHAEIDESSLTGEPYSIDYERGGQIRSGTVNFGDVLVLKVTKTDQESTYHKIIKMVSDAQSEKSPLIRMADKYSAVFTVITLALCALAYLLSHDLTRVLAVLVIATPCPLILATPIAMIGGVNSAASRKIIVKRLASLEVLSKVNALIFDKTGTLTHGKPTLKKITPKDGLTEGEALAIAAAIERNSLHPLAIAIVRAAHQQQAAHWSATHVAEIVGKGIAGEVNGHKYRLEKFDGQVNKIQLLAGKDLIAQFEFEDKLKKDSLSTMKNLQQQGMGLYLFTGDQQVRADELATELGLQMTVKANCSPEDKKNGVQELKRQGLVTGMVGDGINDAPALAIADVGMVFSNEAQTASSEAADIVFLAGNLDDVTKAVTISRRTTHIALQSILIGIGLSIVGMGFAAFGLIIPVVGAFIQEAIDVGVILNALRASQTKV